MLAAACSVDESSLLPTCPAGSVARGGLCSPVSTTSNLQISPERIDFGGIAIGGSTTRSFDIRNAGDSAQTVRVLRPDNSAFTISVLDEDLNIEAGQTLEVSVTFAPTDRNPAMSNIRIETCPGGCARYVALSGFGLEVPTYLRCGTLRFATTPLGECTYDMMICRNEGASTARITDVRVESYDGSIELSGLRLPLTIAPGATEGIPLSFCPRERGPTVAQVNVTTSDGMTVPAFAEGTAPEVGECRLSYNRTVDFGLVQSGTAQEGEVTIQNRGDRECYLAVTGLSTGSTPPFSIDPNLERPLGPGRTWTIAIHMAPSPAGLYVGELRFERIADEPFVGTVAIRAQVIDAGTRLTVSSTASGPLVPLQGATPMMWQGSDDDGTAELMLPFPFTFFGTPRQRVWISTNGFVSFAPDNVRELNNTALPNPSGPNEVIAWWWDDLYPGQSAGPGAQWLVEGADGQRILRMQFPEIVRFGQDPDLHVSAEVRLYEADSRVEVQYGAASVGPNGDLFSATAGWEGPGGIQGADILGCSPNCTAADWPAFTTWTYREEP